MSRVHSDIMMPQVVVPLDSFRAARKGAWRSGIIPVLILLVSATIRRVRKILLAVKVPALELGCRPFRRRGF